MDFEDVLLMGRRFRLVHAVLTNRVVVALHIAVNVSLTYLLVSKGIAGEDKSHILPVITIPGISTALFWALSAFHAKKTRSRRWLVALFVCYPASFVYLGKMAFSRQRSDAGTERTVSNQEVRISRLYIFWSTVMMAMILAAPVVLVLLLQAKYGPFNQNGIYDARTRVCKLLVDRSTASPIDELNDLIRILEQQGSNPANEQDLVLAHIELLSAYRQKGDQARAAEQHRRVMEVGRRYGHQDLSSDSSMIYLMEQRELCPELADKTIYLFRPAGLTAEAIATDIYTYALDSDGVLYGVGDESLTVTSIGESGSTTEHRISDAVSVATTGLRTCIIKKDSTVECWGSYPTDDHMWMRCGARESFHSDPNNWVSKQLTNVKKISVGAAHVCAMKRDGVVECFGLNAYGQLGAGSADERQQEKPTVVPGLPKALDLATGYFHSCVVTDKGEVWCWGRNESGQLGDGTRDDRSTPVRIQLPEPATQIAAGNWHTCALTRSKQVYCWGSLGLNFEPQIEDDSPMDTYRKYKAAHPDCRWQIQTLPALQVMAKGAVEIAAGGSYTCLIDENGQAGCWGGGSYAIDHLTTIQETEDVSKISVGKCFACALHKKGEMICWGEQARSLAREVSGGEFPFNMRSIEYSLENQ